MKNRWKFLTAAGAVLLLIALWPSYNNEQAPPGEPTSSAGEGKYYSIEEQMKAPAAAPNTAQPPPTSSMPNPVSIEPPPPEAMMVEPSRLETSAPTKKIGNILFNPPTKMILGVTEIVEVRVARNKISEENLSGSGAIQTDTLPISERMSIRLCCGDKEDDPFAISTASPKEQPVDNPIVGDNEFTEWVFQVTPKKSGPQQLILYASAHYQFQNGEPMVKDEVFKRDIDIQVDSSKQAQNWLAEQWHWLGLLLVIPLAAVLISRRRKTEKVHPTLSGNESVFISYRRDDSSGYTLAIYEKLKSALGDEGVFMDMDDIPHGENFAKHIEKVLNKAYTVLVMIGKGWLNASNAKGRRLDEPGDYVRMEIATALSKDLRVIPVLLRGEEMPTPEALPEDLQDLCMRNAIRIHDDQFDASIQRLIQSISH